MFLAENEILDINLKGKIVSPIGQPHQRSSGAANTHVQVNSSRHEAMASPMYFPWSPLYD